MNIRQDMVEYAEVDVPRYLRCQAVVRGWQARRVYLSARRRAPIVRELLQTERSYERQLESLEKLFLKPVEAICGVECARRVFQNLAEVHRGVVGVAGALERATEGAESWVPGPNMGEVLLSCIGLLVPHIDFVVNFQSALDSLEELQRTNDLFARTVSTAESMPELKGHDLRDLLILPVQRLPRYLMLASDLASRTPPQHPDCKAIRTAQLCVSRLCSFTNERKRKRESVLQVSKELVGPASSSLLMNNWRYLVQKGPGHAVLEAGPKPVRLDSVFLFNDLILLAKKSHSSPGKLKVLRTVDLADGMSACAPQPGMSSPSARTGRTALFGLTVTPAAGAPPLQLFAESKSSADEWLTSLQDISEAREWRLDTKYASFTVLLEREFPNLPSQLPSQAKQ